MKEYLFVWTAGIILTLQHVVVADSSCWHREDLCIIDATLQTAAGVEALQSTTKLELDCARIDSASVNKSEHDNSSEKRKQQVLLNGCRTPPFRTITYGYDLLPNCNSIISMVVERFRSDTLHAFHCNGTTLTELFMRNNEIGTISASALLELSALRSLQFSGNSLRHVERRAFDALISLEHLRVEQEMQLALKESELLEKTTLRVVELTSLMRITPQLFEQLPVELRALYVAHSPIGDGAVTVKSGQKLSNVSLIDCELRVFELHDVTGSVKLMNLSGNAIEMLRWVASNPESTTLNVETLDISRNKLTQLPWHWFSELPQLRTLLLRENLFKTLSLTQLLMSAPKGQFIDLRSNQLGSLQDTASLELSDARQVHVQIDRNPWNCLWLLQFAHAHPEKFRIFRYDKYISQINVNGLECNPEVDKSSSDADTTQLPLLDTTITVSVSENNVVPSTEATFLNVSTYTLVYGNPWDYKRNQRAEALIIVFMLPLGIAFLFLLLYMWIHCQRMFHLSYYRSFPLIGLRSAPNSPVRSAERFDVVRQFPPNTSSSAILTAANNNEDYELPISDDGYGCNCTSHSNHGTANGDVSHKCQKSHNITYVALPTEQPYKLYEEILDERDDAQLPSSESCADIIMTPQTSLYDHLTFSEPNGID